MTRHPERSECNERSRGTAILLALLLPACHGATQTAEPAGPSVPVTTAQFGDIAVTVRAVGRLGSSAGANSKLAFAVNGRLSQVFVHVGERVSAGEALAQVDTTNYALAQQQAQADAAAAAAQAQAAAVDRTSTKLRVDRQALEREQRLYAAGVAAHKDVEAAQAQLASDRADASTNVANRQAAQAQAESASAKAALAARDSANATLRAPAAGVVTQILHNPGESVDPTLPVVALAPTQSSAITLDVVASDAARITPGDPVTMRVDATGQTLGGRVAGVAGAVDPTTQTAQVQVAAGVPSGLTGSAVSADIAVARNRGVLVPRSAVVADPQSGETLVFVQTKEKGDKATFKQRSVRVVFGNEKQAEVTGLNAGEKIASQGAFELLAPTSGGE